VINFATAKPTVKKSKKTNLVKKGKSNATKSKQKIIVTAALPYVNNVPHLGNLIPTLSADVYSRYLRLKEENVIFVCGTDEHGTTTETKAIEEGVTPKEICDKYFAIHKEIYEWFNLGFDCFGRTSSPENKEITVDIFQKLDKNGYIVSQKTEQFYCPKDQRFLADRFIGGECPSCGYKEARGDQCENCGKLLNATELVNPKCRICGTTPVIKESEHLFIDLKKLEPKLLKWMKGVEANWSVNARTMTHAWIKEGLKLRCITRDLKWGISVPKKGFENKVFYSWFDAPIGYIGITSETKKDWKKWWLNPYETKLVQFMGKDNIPFHTILFPCFLIGTDDDYTLMSEISVNEYLNYESGMFSKSRNIGVFGDDARSTGIKADLWRYYLMMGRPETNDYQFTWKDFQARVNSELVANIGNLINRTFTFINNFFDSVIPAPKLSAKDKELMKKLEEEYDKLDKLFVRQNLREALKQILNISRLGNQYFQEEEPWKKIKEDKERAGTSLFVLANICKDLSIIIQPYMPEASANAQEILGLKDLKWKDLGKMTVKEGTKIKKAEILFNKIEDKLRDECEKKFAGKKEVKVESKPSNLFPLNLKVAKILEAREHPKADKLMILQLDVGTEKRQIVAGIRKHYNIDQLIGRNIVIVSNLKPAVLRGEESKGMLLAGVANDKVRLLSAPNSKPGDKVGIDSKENNTSEITWDDFEKIKMTVKNKKVVCEGKHLKTGSEEISVDIEDGANVS